jgi:hypothetical protein
MAHKINKRKNSKQKVVFDNLADLEQEMNNNSSVCRTVQEVIAPSSPQ